MFAEVDPNEVHGGLNRGFKELRNFCVVYVQVCVSVHWQSECDLPGQRQPPSLDPALGVIVPWGAESDVLSRLVIREYPLNPFVELLRKCCQVFWGVELGATEFPLLRTQ